MSPNELPKVMTEAYHQFLNEDLVLWPVASIMPPLPNFLVGAINVMNTVARVEGLPEQAKTLLEIATSKANESMPPEHKLKEYWEHCQPIIFQMILSRGMDNFIAYLAGILTALFRQNPNLLLSNQKSVTNNLATEEEIADLAEDTVNRLTRKSMSKLSEYFANQLDFVLFSRTDDYERTYYINEVRNIIIHNRARVDKKFISHVPNTTFRQGDLIQLELDDVLDDFKLLKWIAADIDARVISKFNLPVLRPRTR